MSDSTHPDTSLFHEAITLPPAPTADAATAPWSAQPSGAPVAVPGYEILAELGRGGMGVVYKARHVGLNRLVALKMVLAGAHAGPEDLARFRGEAEAVARLKHPNVVQIYDIGASDGLPYFSLELIEGGNLDRKLAGTPLPPEQAAALVETLAQAMAAAHAAGLVHRDLKPANVLLTVDGTPKVTDFGLVKRIDAASPGQQPASGLTVSGAILGTPSYMAPEQAGGRSKEIGPACDIYALGAILYECLTGRPPFKAATPLDTIVQVIADDPVAPRHLNPRVPIDLETICQKCLMKEPRRRYATAQELADDLRRYAEGRPIRARRVGRIERTVKWVKRRPAVAAALVGAVVLMLGGAFFLAATWAGSKEAGEKAAREELDRFRTQVAQEREQQQKEEQERARTLQEEQDRKQRELQEVEDRKERSRQLAMVAVLWDEYPQAALHLLEDARLFPPEARDPVWESYHRLCGLDRRALQGDRPRFVQLATTPDAKLLLTVDNFRTIRVWGWEQNTLKERTSLRQPAMPRNPVTGFQVTVPRSVSMSADAALLTYTNPSLNDSPLCDIVIHDVISGKDRTFQEKAWGNLLLSPDGKMFLFGHQLYDATTGERSCALERGFRPDAAVLWAFSPDSKLVAGAILFSGGRGVTSRVESVQLWDVATGRQYAQFKDHLPASLHRLAFSPDGLRLAARFGPPGDAPPEVLVWDVPPPGEAPQDAVRKGQLRDAGLAASTQAVPSEEELLAAIERVGGTVTRDPKADGHPIVAVVLKNEGFSAGILGELKNLKSLRTLTLEGFWDPLSLRGLKDLKGVRELRLSWETISDFDLTEVTELTDLTVLHLTLKSSLPPGVTDAGLKGLGRLKKLTDLHLTLPNPEDRIQQSQITEAGLNALVGELKELETLSLEPVWVTDSLLETLGKGRRLHVLSQTQATDGKRPSSAADVRVLDLRGSRVTSDGLGLALKEFADLQTLFLDPERLTDGALRTLASSGRLHVLSQAQGPDGKRPSGPADVVALDLHSTGVTDSGLKELKALTNLQTLDLRYCPVWDGGMKELKGFAKLRALDLADTRVTAVGMKELLDLANLQTLNRDARNARAEAYAEAGQWEKAAADFAQVIEQGANNPATWQRLALLRLQLGDAAGYRAVCASLRRHFLTPTIDQGNTMAWTCSLGPDVLTVGDLQLALRATATGEKYPYLNTLGAAYYRAGQFEAAVARLDQAVKSHGSGGTAVDWFLLALAYHRLGQTNDAKVWLDRALKAVEQSPREKIGWVAWLELQQLRREAEHPEENDKKALAALDQTIKDKPQDAAGWAERARFHQWRRHYEQAARDYARLMELQPSEPAWHSQRGRVFAAQQEWKKAADDFLKVVEQRPNDPNARLECGLAFAQSKQWPQAVTQFAKALDLGNVPATVWYHTALAHAAAGQTTEYRRLCQQLLERKGQGAPPSLVVLQCCRLLPEAVTDLAPVAKLAEKEAAADATYPAQQLYGQILYRAGRFEAAEQQLDRAMKLRPDQRDLSYASDALYLAMAHQRLDETEEAKRWLKRAVQVIEDREKAKAGATETAGAWDSRQMLQLLRQEAEALVK